jgi:hypothetical protein
MLFTLTQVLAQAEPVRIPSYFPWVAMTLLTAGGVGWLVAAVLGFARARVFGASARWFALSAVCLLIYHVQWLVFAVYGVGERNPGNVLGMAAFFNLFVALGGLCAVIGFVRLTKPGP